MKSFDETVLEWYDSNARTLPWRGTKDPYRIWLSEIMLQQTRAETVVRYYNRFLELFPDVNALAQAPQDVVLKAWEGLGYYSRAHNLQAAAKRVAATGGRFPADASGLKSLPGIGPYVANAIASIAYNECVPALDGNQMRVLSRCFAVERILNTPFDLLSEALLCISHDRPGDYNQALMDIGSGICKSRNPRCDSCPLRGNCIAYTQHCAERYPMKPAPVAKRDEDHTILLIEHNGRICIRKRSEKGLLGGLYEFFNAEGKLSPGEAVRFLKDQEFSVTSEPIALPSAKHVFTHIIWHMNGYLIHADSVPENTLSVDAYDISRYAFPSALKVYRSIAGELLRDMIENDYKI